MKYLMFLLLDKRYLHKISRGQGHRHQQLVLAQQRAEKGCVTKQELHCDKAEKALRNLLKEVYNQAVSVESKWPVDGKGSKADLDICIVKEGKAELVKFDVDALTFSNALTPQQLDNNPCRINALINMLNLLHGDLVNAGVCSQDIITIARCCLAIILIRHMDEGSRMTRCARRRKSE